MVSPGQAQVNMQPEPSAPGLSWAQHGSIGVEPWAQLDTQWIMLDTPRNYSVLCPSLLRWIEEEKEFQMETNPRGKGRQKEKKKNSERGKKNSLLNKKKLSARNSHHQRSAIDYES